MTKKEIVSKLLTATQGQSTNAGGAGWLGQVSGVQQQVNIELARWNASGNDSILYGIIELLETVSALSGAEANELRNELDSAT